MKYQKSERIQREDYSSVSEFLQDITETLLDEDNYDGTVNVIADADFTEVLMRELCNADVNGFKFDLQVVDFTKIDDVVAEFRTTILNDGEVFIEPAICKGGIYNDCDGFIFLQDGLSEDALNGNNRRCDAMIFTVND